MVPPSASGFTRSIRPLEHVGGFKGHCAVPRTMAGEIRPLPINWIGGALFIRATAKRECSDTNRLTPSGTQERERDGEAHSRVVANRRVKLNT